MILVPSSDGFDDLPDLRTLTATRSILPRTYHPILSEARIATQESDIDLFTSPIQPKPRATRPAVPLRNRQRSTTTNDRSSSSLSPVPLEERNYNPPSSPIPLRKNIIKKRGRPIEERGSSIDPVAKKSRTKEQEKADKAAAKAKLQAEKQAEKVQKKRFTEVNKVIPACGSSVFGMTLIRRNLSRYQLRTSKSDTLREVKLCLSPELLVTPSPIAAAIPALRDKFRENSSEIGPLERAACPGLITFKRFVRANWDGERGVWVPIEVDKEAWVAEGLAVVFIQADELVDKIRCHLDLKADKIQPDEVLPEDTLEGWIHQLKAGLKIHARACKLTTDVPFGQQPPTYPRDKDGRPGIMLVIHGMKAYHSKTKSAAQREFAARAKAALAEIEGSASGESAPGKKKPTTKGKTQAPRLEKDDIERELVAIHLRHGWLQVQGQFPR